MNNFFCISCINSNHFHVNLTLLYLRFIINVMHKQLFSASLHHILPLPSDIFPSIWPPDANQLMQEHHFSAFLHQFPDLLRWPELEIRSKLRLLSGGNDVVPRDEESRLLTGVQHHVQPTEASAGPNDVVPRDEKSRLCDMLPL